MNRAAWIKLKTGDQVRNKITNQIYVLVGLASGGWIATRTLVIREADQWRKLTESERETQ